VYKTGESGGNFETTPIMVGGVLYLSTQAQRIVALEPETGKEIWSFNPKSRRLELRGVSYRPGDKQNGARIVFGTSNSRLIALDAKTGTPAASFGDNGTVNLRVGANTGDIAWRSPLGTYPAFPNAGAPNLGGPIATAGGLVFIGATVDSKFRAFDSRTSKEVWTAAIDGSALTVPMTYQGKDGKQYVVIAAGGPGRFRSLVATRGVDADTLIAFTLP
jgi:glucose dehydrogenase